MKSSLVQNSSSLPEAAGQGLPVNRDLRDSAIRGAPAAARAVLHLLEQLAIGTLRITLPNHRELSFGNGTPVAQVSVHDWAVFDAVLRKGDIGFAESWFTRQWTSPQLSDVIDLMIVNREQLERVVYGSWWGQIVYRLRHALNRNSRAGSKRNIHAHYDLGNSFYSLWLDRTMTYSSAVFEGNMDRPLEDAQQAKYQRLFESAGVSAGDAVLEIGCGWGGFAEHATSRGVQVTGLTISSEQLAFASDRLQRAGLSAQSRLLLEDYRDHSGHYDAVVSVEMFEAVGERYWPSYFGTVSRCLKPGGRAAIQSIVIAESLFERYRRGTDFIQQYVFPGGMLPSRIRFVEAAKAAGLECVEQYAFGGDYARTLQAWRHRFMARLDQVLAQGFDQRFVRLWEFYLAYCESAFRHGNTDVVQFTLVKPR